MSKSKYLLYSVGGIQALINFIEIILIFKQCTPTEKLWDIDIAGKCDMIDICSKVGFVQGSTSSLLELYDRQFSDLVQVSERPLTSFWPRTLYTSLEGYN
jgi:hypothetical protein